MFICIQTIRFQLFYTVNFVRPCLGEGPNRRHRRGVVVQRDQIQARRRRPQRLPLRWVPPELLLHEGGHPADQDGVAHARAPPRGRRGPGGGRLRGEPRVLCKVYRSPRHPGEVTPPAPRKRAAAADDESSASPRPKGKADDDEGSKDAGRGKSDGEGSSAATVAVPRDADDEIPDTAAAAATPGRKEKEAEGDESSVVASAAEPARNKRKIEGDLHCPQCGCHLDAEAVLAAAKAKSETGVAQVEGDSLVKDHSFHQFF
jgi:hypothetical protein